MERFLISPLQMSQAKPHDDLTNKEANNCSIILAFTERKEYQS